MKKKRKERNVNNWTHWKKFELTWTFFWSANNQLRKTQKLPE